MLAAGSGDRIGEGNRDKKSEEQQGNQKNTEEEEQGYDAEGRFLQ
jgi:hypothetical protein